MIRVLIVDDAPLMRANIERLLTSERDLEACGTAGDSNSAMARTEELRPDVILVDMDLPGIDGLRTTERLTRSFPGCLVIIMGLDDDDATREMVLKAGARTYLVKPFGGEELLGAIRRIGGAGTSSPPVAIAEPPPAPEAVPTSLFAPSPPSSDRQIIAVVSAKGGSGTTVVAANLALIIANEAHRRVALVDLDVEHGHIQRLLRLEPAATIVQAVHGGPGSIAGCLVAGPANISVLASPSYQVTAVDPAGLDPLIAAMRDMFDVVVVDVPNRLGPAEAAVLRRADRIILLGQMSDLGLRATVGLRRTLEALGISGDRVVTALNRIEANSDLTKANVEEAMGQEVAVQLPYDPILVSTSMNRGAPFVLQRPDAQVSRKVRELASLLVPMPTDASEPSAIPRQDGGDDASDRLDAPRPKQRRGRFGFARS